MKQNPDYTKYHPGWYRIRMPIFWWAHKWVYIKFILRELTSVPVGLYALVLLYQIHALSQGSESYAAFTAWLRTPVSLLFHMIALLFVVFHSVTWFNLAPKALVLRIGKKRIPGWAIAAVNYITWIILSVLITWLILEP